LELANSICPNIVMLYFLQKAHVASTPSKNVVIAKKCPTTTKAAHNHDNVLISSTPQPPMKHIPVAQKSDINSNSLPAEEASVPPRRKGPTRSRRKGKAVEEEEKDSSNCEPTSPTRTTLLGTLFSPVFQFFGNQGEHILISSASECDVLFFLL
jgi:hypothetical protein